MESDNTRKMYRVQRKRRSARNNACQEGDETMALGIPPSVLLTELETRFVHGQEPAEPVTNDTLHKLVVAMVEAIDLNNRFIEMQVAPCRRDTPNSSS
jgi:hypothetical protein